LQNKRLAPTSSVTEIPRQGRCESNGWVLWGTLAADRAEMHLPVTDDMEMLMCLLSMLRLSSESPSGSRTWTAMTVLTRRFFLPGSMELYGKVYSPEAILMANSETALVWAPRRPSKLRIDPNSQRMAPNGSPERRTNIDSTEFAISIRSATEFANNGEVSPGPLQEVPARFSDLL